MRALLGGGALLATVALWHRPAHPGAAGVAPATPCGTGGASGLCDAASGLKTALGSPLLAGRGAAVLPPADVPGAIDPRVDPNRLDATICRPGYARSVRPAYAITGPLKRRMMAAQHPGEPLADYELDHLIPISLGGAPLDPKNLWLQPRLGRANAADKNALAYVLWRLVCTHRLSLRTAQQAIRQDWVAAYDRYATPENLARYHFRHGQTERD